jgi:thiol:disulfide interchange protein
MLKKLTSLIVLVLSLSNAFAQLVADPTTWSFSTKKTGEKDYDVIFDLKLQPHWHIWSLEPGGDGLLMPPSFTFDRNSDLQLVGKMVEKGKLNKKEFPGTDGICNFYENSCQYIQKVKVKANTAIKGKVNYQVCDDKGCLPPKNKSFSLSITDADPKKAVVDTVAVKPATTVSVLPKDTPLAATTNATSTIAAVPTTSSAPVDTTISATSSNANTAAQGCAASSLLGTWFTGFGWGLASVVTPCVFAMLPMTVGFFLKRSKSKAQGRKNALIYALSIIAILTALGALISVIGGNALNNLSTHWVVNLVFFAIFLIFGISFLGAFELSLPSSLSTATDKKANTNSIVGIFFMALTLVIVSFSCTGPFLGNMLIESIKGGRLGPIVGFNGFAVGLALPFAATALFPALLEKATQGGWLNAVKVTFGIVELALALKFLSNADLAKQWRLLDREIFIAIWVVLAVVLALYLFGIIKFSHDSELPENHHGVKYLSVPRTLFGIAALSFAIYLMPGMWGAPLKGMSAFLPPMGTQDFVLSSGSGAHGGGASEIKTEGGVKYADKMGIYEPESVKNFGLSTYFDYDEALAASKRLKKPIMLDFTGINCVNCRKMEAQVWSNPEVLKRLKEHFIIASLYCDADNISLPPNEHYESKYLGTTVTTLGDKNEDLQASKFNSNSQPYYFFVDGDGKLLVKNGYSYDPNVTKFIAHLDAVVAAYSK